MNQFLVDGVLCHAVYRDNPYGMGEERGGCCQLDGRDFQECCDCVYEGQCPADGEEGE